MKYENQNFKGERAQFFSCDDVYENCVFDDGESPLKESKNAKLNNCTFGWKYPLWYSKNSEVKNTLWLKEARSGVWYAKNISVENSRIIAPKNFRRCENVKLSSVVFEDALETMWGCNGVLLENVTVKGDYFGMNSENISAKNLKIDGNYCFDGGKNIEVTDSTLNSKDSFWNVKNAVVRNSTIIGEYIGWNSENLTFVNCHIESHQGFCYIKGLKLVNCTLKNTDLAFEYCSDIDADIAGTIDSVKNPTSGTIVADKIDEIILEENRVDVKAASIKVRK